MTESNGAVRRGPRVAFIGKGGSGKSTISGTVARLFARSGWPVLALDVDTLPGMAYSLGAPPDAAPRLPLGLASVVQGKRGRYWKIGKGAGAAHQRKQARQSKPENPESRCAWDSSPHFE